MSGNGFLNLIDVLKYLEVKLRIWGKKESHLFYLKAMKIYIPQSIFSNMLICILKLKFLS